MPLSLYDIEQAELWLAVERKRAANPNEGPPDFHDGVRFGEAATLATVTPLGQQMLQAHYGFQNAQIAFLMAARAEEPDEAVERLNRVYQAAAAELDRAAGNLDAFLSGATKETDHVGVR